MRCWTAAATALAILITTPALAAPTALRAARVAPPALSASTTHIEVELVVAREKGPVDPGLEGVARQLKSKGLNSVRRVTTESVTVRKGGVVSARVDGRRMKVTLLELEGDRARVRYDAYRDGEELFHQVFWTPSGKTGPLAGMGSYRGGKLFGVITVGQ